MFEITNKDALMEQLDRWEAEVYDLTLQVYVGLSVKLFSTIVNGSAQYSGDYAANWKLSVGKPNYTFTPYALGEPQIQVVNGRLAAAGSKRKMGHSQAIAYAFAGAAGTLAGAALNEDIFITNSAAHDEPYAWLIENGVIKFRQGNQGKTVSRALGSLSKYAVISRAEAQRLKRVKI